MFRAGVAKPRRKAATKWLCASIQQYFYKSFKTLDDSKIVIVQGASQYDIADRKLNKYQSARGFSPWADIIYIFGKTAKPSLPKKRGDNVTGRKF